VTVFHVVLPKEAYACWCGPNDRPVEEAKVQAEAIFAGKIIGITEGNDNSTAVPGGFAFEDITFEVLTVWKGVSQADVTIRDYLTDCSVDFQKGSSYLVFASHDNGDESVPLSTSKCTRTRLASKAEADIMALGQGRNMSQASPLHDLTTPALVFLVLFVSTTLVVIVFRHKSRSTTA
jgi:hypothetical protein